MKVMPPCISIGLSGATLCPPTKPMAWWCQVESELTRDEDRDSRSKAIRESGRSSIARDDRKSISGDGGPARWSGDDAEETVIASVIIIPKGDDGDSGDDDEADESEEEEQVEKGGGSVAMGDTPWEEEEDESEEKSSGRG